MAKYRAITGIKYSGEGVEGVKRLEAGEFVTGLPAKTMQELWDAGVLERVEDEPKPVEAPEQTLDGGDSGQTLEPTGDEGKQTEEPPKEQ